MVTERIFDHESMNQEPTPDRKLARRMSAGFGLAQASTLGLQFAFSIIIGAAIGYGLDRLFHTRPWLMLVFFGFGIVSGFVSIIRAVRAANK